MTFNSEFDFSSLSREDLEQLATESVLPEDYYDLMDTIGELSGDELIRIILAKYTVT